MLLLKSPLVIFEGGNSQTEKKWNDEMNGYVCISAKNIS